MPGFEDLIAWQKAREFTRVIYEATRGDAFGKDYRLVAQVRAASVSIMSNIAEGYVRGNRGEFHQAFVTAKGECGEVRSQLYVAVDEGYLKQEMFSILRDRTLEESKILESLRAQVASQRESYRQSRKRADQQP